MKRAIADKPVLRALAMALLAAFAFGSASGPLRTCLTHPGHTSGSHAGTSDVSHGHSGGHSDHHSAGRSGGHSGGHSLVSPAAPASAAGPDAPTSGHDGCSCLGRCSLEHAPSLAAAAQSAAAHVPGAPKALAASAARSDTGRAPFDLPLARPPPAVV